MWLQPEMLVRFFLLVTLLSLIPVTPVPVLLRGAVSILLLAATLAGATGAYQRIWWLDDLAHGLVPGSLALMERWC